MKSITQTNNWQYTDWKPLFKYRSAMKWKTYLKWMFRNLLFLCPAKSPSNWNMTHNSWLGLVCREKYLTCIYCDKFPLRSFLLQILYPLYSIHVPTCNRFGFIDECRGHAWGAFNKPINILINKILNRLFNEVNVEVYVSKWPFLIWLKHWSINLNIVL